VGIRVLDEMTLQIELEHPATFFLEWLTNPLYAPVCHSLLKRHETLEPSGIDGYICNGPYILRKKEINQYIELEKNTRYWNAGAVQNEGILFSIIEDVSTAFNLFCKGELDWFGEPVGVMSPEMTEALIQQKKLHVANGGLLNWIRCNVTVKHLSSPKIRKAIACSINRRELASKLMFDLVFPSFTIVPAKQSLLQQPAFRDHDVEKASRLFKEGLLELGLTPDTFPPLTLSCQADARSIAICELVISQIHKALGITVHMQVLDIKRFWDEIFQNRLELSFAGWISGLTDPIYNLESMKEIGGHYKTTGWENQEYADLLNASDAEVDPKKRAELLLAAEMLIMDEMPVIPILELPFRYAKQNNIKGEFFTPIGRLELSGLERHA
jgi:oligopeptide transport system substrate-binding protein